MYVHECVINLQVINMTCRQVINLLDRHNTNYHLSPKLSIRNLKQSVRNLKESVGICPDLSESVRNL